MTEHNEPQHTETEIETAAEVETAEAVETEQTETQPEAPTYEELQARIARSGKRAKPAPPPSAGNRRYTQIRRTKIRHRNAAGQRLSRNGIARPKR